MADEKQENPPPTPPTDAKKDAEAKPDAKAEAKADAKPAAAAGAAASWIPVLVVIVILPILSLAVTDLVMIPRVKKAIAEIAVIQKEGDQPAHGGPAPTAKKEEKKNEKGGGEAGKEVKFENIVANLAGAMKTRFVKVSFSLEGQGDDFKSTIEGNRTKLIDSALSILGGLTIAELDEPGIKNIVRSDLINSFNQILGGKVITGLYFSEFVIQ